MLNIYLNVQNFEKTQYNFLREIKLNHCMDRLYVL